jgi:hypothetical protein
MIDAVVICAVEQGWWLLMRASRGNVHEGATIAGARPVLWMALTADISEHMSTILTEYLATTSAIDEFEYLWHRDTSASSILECLS